MTWDVLSLLKSPLSARVAWIIVIAGALAGCVLRFAGPDPITLVARAGAAAATTVVVVAAVYAYAVATLIVLGIAWLARAVQDRRAAIAAKACAKLDEERRKATAAAEEARLATLLAAFPTTHLDVLARFAGDEEHIVLPRPGPAAEGAITQSLLESGYLVHIAPIDQTRAMYALHPAAVRPVREHFERARSKAAAERRAQVEETVSRADAPTRRFLSLFGDSDPEDPNTTPHGRLTADVYAALDGLERRGVVTRLPPAALAEMRRVPLVEHRYLVPVELTEVGRSAVEHYILGRPVARTRFAIHLDQVESRVGSGSGAGEHTDS